MSDYTDALLAFTDFNEGAPDKAENAEYARGQLELLAQLFAVPGVEGGDRIEQIEADLCELDRLLDDERSEALAEAAADLTAALRTLYRLNDGDEGGVGEIEYECHKVARATYLDYENYPTD